MRGRWKKRKHPETRSMTDTEFISYLYAQLVRVLRVPGKMFGVTSTTMHAVLLGNTWRISPRHLRKFLGNLLRSQP